MKVSQVLKLSAVVLALGSMPLHTAFATENESAGETQSEAQSGVDSGMSYGEGEAQVEASSSDSADTAE